MAKTTAQPEHRKKENHPNLGARISLPYSKHLNVFIICINKISENLVAEGNSCLLPSTCICNSPEFELGKVQDLSGFPVGPKERSASKFVKDHKSERTDPVSHTHSTMNILWPYKSSSVKVHTF